MDSLADRLKSLGFKTAASIPQKATGKRETLEEAVGGKVVSNSLGEFVIKETLFPLDHQHGIVSFSAQVVTDTISRAAKIDSNSASLEKLLFIDTETSGLSGGAGTFAFLVGYGRFTADGFLLTQLIIRDPGEEAAMLLYLMKVVEDDVIFVSFNGKSFDIPLLQNRLVMNRLSMKLRELQHLDMLHISRKLWRRSLASCALKDLETAILKFERTSEDVPGWMIPDIYFSYLRTGDPSGLTEVVYHNAQDIVSLAALFLYVTGMLEENISIENLPVNDLIAIGRIYWDLGSLETGVNIIRATLPRVKDPDQKTAVNSLLGQYYKKIQLTEKSIEHWEAAAKNGDVPSCVELAMYFEHQVKDYNTALVWCEKAISYGSIGVNFVDSKMITDLQKRLTRLQQKRRNNV